MAKTLPETGLSRDEIITHLTDLKKDDIKWAEGRTPMFIFKADTELSKITQEAFNLYFNENALGAHRAYKSIRQMEDDIIAIGLDLFNAPAGGQGYFTTGGTESIMCAVKTAKTWARDKRGDPGFHGNIVAAESAHPAFRKSCDLMDIEIRKLPVKDYRADPAALEAAIDENTFMIIGSAPCFPYGTVDPIEELSEIALRHDLWLHVDACVGGYMLPFAEELGQKIPVWDFRAPGVASISADLHKFGYAPKPASTVFFRSQEHAKHLVFFYNEWPSGLYATATVVGTRPGGGVAGAWATLHALGHQGYLDVTRRLLDLIARYKKGIEAIPGLKVIDDPQLAIIAFTSDEVDLLQVGSHMPKRGWLPSFLQKPKGMHLMLSLIHEQACDKWLEDLRWAVDQQRAAAPGSQKKVDVVY